MITKKSNRASFFGKHRDLLVCLCLIIAALAVYWQVGTHEFISFDDNEYITENRPVQAGLTAKGIAWAFTSAHSSNWHPVTWLSHMLDCQLYGMNSGWHHLTNVFFHIANAVLLFLVFRRMTGSLWRSALVAALFALHPLHVESVAWMAERKDVLSTLFWLLTMWGYVWYAERPALGRYLLVLLLFILGLMAKPMLVTLPFVLLLLDYWPLKRFQLDKSDDSSRYSRGLHLIREKIPFFALAAASSVVTFLVQQSQGAVRSFDQYPLGLRIANALVSYVSYIGKMIWPRNLAVFYPFPEHIPLWQVAGACLALALISVFAVRTARRRPYFVVGWLWYVGTLVPVIGLVQVGKQAMADRYTYIPLIGIFVIVAWAVPDLTARSRSLKIGIGTAAATLLSILAAMICLQLRHWTDTITLFEHALDSTTNNWLAHNHLGVALAEQGKAQDAIRHYDEALRIDPDYLSAQINLGAVLAAQGKVDDAINHYSEALRIDPDSLDARNNLGSALVGQGKLDEAIHHYSEALRIDPYYANTHYNLAVALAAQGRIDDAIRHYSETLRIDPDYAIARYNLAVTLAAQGRYDEAIRQYAEALRTNPNNISAHINLGAALARQGKTDEAISHYYEALRIDPDSLDAHNNLAVALAAQGKIDEAIRHYSEALRIKPDYANAHINLGILLARQGKYDSAVDHYSKALSASSDSDRPLDDSSFLLPANYNMAIALAKQGKYDEAINRYSEVLKIDPNFVNAHINMGNILGQMGKIDEALIHFREALRITPNNPSLHLAVGNIQKMKGNLEEAISQYEKALSIQPRYAVALNNLGGIYSIKGEYDRAISTYLKMIELQPYNPVACYNIARVYSKQNKVEESIDWLQKAVDMGFQDWDFLKADKDFENIKSTSFYQKLISPD